MLDMAQRPATEIFLQHAQNHICWERAEAPEDEREAAEQDAVDDIKAAMEPGRTYKRSELTKLAADVLDVAKDTLRQRTRRAGRIFTLLLEQTEVRVGDTPFYRLPSAKKRDMDDVTLDENGEANLFEDKDLTT